MESKITIDITNDGRPFLYINFKPSDDLRDKVLGRFIFESGCCHLSEKGELPTQVYLALSALYHDEKTGIVQAMIEIPATEEPKQTDAF